MPRTVSLLVLGLLALDACILSARALEISTEVLHPVRSRLRARSRPDAQTEDTGVALVKRIVPRPLVTVRQNDPTAAESAAFATGLPAGTLIDGEFIVLYKEGIVDVTAAVADSQARAIQAVRDAATSGDATNGIAIDPESLQVNVVSVAQAPAGVPSQAVITVPGQVDAAAVKKALQNSDSVLGVVQNRIVATTQSGRSCYPASFAAGVQGNPASGVTFAWNECLKDSTTKLALFGERCGTNRDKFRWNGIYAFNPSNNQLIKSSTGACVRFRTAETDATRLQQFFGDCGVAPKNFANLPTTVCMEDASSSCVDASALPNYVTSLSRSLCTAGSPQATFQGAPCGPNNALIQWSKLSPKGCNSVSRDGSDLKTQADWVGQCGVPPLQINGIATRICGRVPVSGNSGGPVPAPPPSSPPSAPPPAWNGGSLPIVPVKAGESTNWGVGRVGSYDPSKKTTADVSAAVAATGFKVAVIDTGSDPKHPDLNVVEFKDFVDAPGSTYYGKDGNGHGSHVAGIIGAKNNGAGVIGVVPNMPILALKVLPKDGSGPLDKVYQAYADVLARLQKGEKIVAINLSLSSVTDDQDAKTIECNWIQKLQSYGTTVCAAAGNDGEDLSSNLPATCDQTLTVTSMDSSDSPSYFSNYASASDDGKKKSLLAAPGSSIYSTYKDGGYTTLSGTSMATPFVTGASAECFLTKKCKLSSQPGVTNSQTTNYPVMLAAAAAAPCNNGKCGPQWGGSGGYYGYYVNTRQF